jgi:hypothetical protein
MVKTKEEYFKEWSDKLSISITDIEKDFNNFLTEENEVHKDLSADERTSRALNRTALHYKRLLKTPATGFEGVIIGVGDCVDMVAKQRLAAITLFKTSPQEAVTNGITDENGVPLDTKEKWGEKINPNFGKPLPEHNYIRNLYGIAIKKKVKDDKPKLFTMTLTGAKAEDETIPIFAPVRFMANDNIKLSTENCYVLRQSTFTKFDIDKTLILPEFGELIKSVLKDSFVELKNLTAYHTANKDNFNRLVITEGDVSSLNLEPTAFGSRIMTIDDEALALENIEGADGITCWLSNRINIDFAEGSKVIVVGKTNQGKKKDELGLPTEELGNVSINVYGVYALPQYKIAIPKVEEITEE